MLLNKIELNEKWQKVFNHLWSQRFHNTSDFKHGGFLTMGGRGFGSKQNDKRYTKRSTA